MATARAPRPAPTWTFASRFRRGAFGWKPDRAMECLDEAAAKSAGLFHVALDLARSSPTDPRTLARAARDFAINQPSFALEEGLLALVWMARGYGYEVSPRDAAMAWEACLAAGKAHGLSPEDIRDRALALCDGNSGAERFVRAEIGLPLGSD